MVFTLAEMLSNTNGKSPLVAATYYFNPGSSHGSGLQRDQPGVLSEHRRAGIDSLLDRLEESEGNDGNEIPWREKDACQAPDGRHGSCYDANECVKRGGTPMGTCGGPAAKSLSGSGVCCLCEFRFVSLSI